MRTENLRLWFLAVFTVVVGSWWQLPSLSARSIDPDGDQFVVYGAGWSDRGHLGTFSMGVAPPRAINMASDPFDDVIDADMGGEHTLLLRADGSVWSLGSNELGQLGVGGTFPRSPVPMKIPGLPAITAVAAGGLHSLALDANGFVWSWGYDGVGQLGLGNPGGAQLQSLPRQILTLSSVVSIAAGEDFSAAVTSDGRIWAWGNNLMEQLGDLNLLQSRNTPVTVATPFPMNAVRVAAGGQTALALLDTGEVVGWGSNTNAQIAPASAGLKVPIANAIATQIVDIAVGGGHILLLTENGKVLARGLGNEGQLGVGSNTSSPSFVTVPGLSGIVDVDAGASHSVAVSGVGLTYTWGANDHKQLGDLTSASSVNLPKQVTGIPVTTRKVVARYDSTLFLNTPGGVNVKTSVPLNISCTNPFDAAISVTGFNTVKTTPADIVLVIDESGSIGLTNFQKMKQFAIDFIQSQDMTRTRVGVVFFSNTARVIANLSNSAQSLINTIQGASYTQGATCIGCGVLAARNMLNTQGFAGADRSIVVVTDGMTTPSLDPTFASIILSAQQSATLFAIGIGANVSASEINFIASDVPGIQTAYLTPDFQSLSLVLTQLSVSQQPGVRNVMVTIELSPSFNLVTPGNVTAGNVSTGAGTIMWTLPTLGAETETLTLPLRGAGAGGSLPLFDTFSYVSDNNPSPRLVASPIADVVGCPASIVLAPSMAQHFLGESHNGSVSVLDAFGSPVTRPVLVQIMAGPNAGRMFNVTPSGVPATFSYSSNVSGIDDLVASTPGVPTASATVAWESKDKTPPTLNVSPDITVDAKSANGSPVTYVVTAVDDVDPTPKIDCTPPSGSLFPVGVTTVMCTATDAAHNSAQGTFNVSVKPVATMLSPLQTNDVIILLPNSPLTASTRLTQTSGTNAPLKGETIRFTVTGPSGTANYLATTAFNGQATLTIPVDQRGKYHIAAEYTGANWLMGSVASSADAGVYLPTGLGLTPPGLGVAGAPTLLSAKLITHNFAPIANQTVRFSFPDCDVAPTTGITDAAGDVSVTVVIPVAGDGDCAVEARFGNAADFFTSDQLPPTDTVVSGIILTGAAGSAVTLLPVNPGPQLLFVGDSLPVSATLDRLFVPLGPVPGETLTFTLTGGVPSTTSTLSAVTNASGVASVAFPLNARGIYKVSAAFDGSPVLSPHATFPSQDIYVFQPTTMIIPAVQGVAGSPVTITAVLTQVPQGTPAAGRTIHLTSPGQLSMTAQTDASGTATIVTTFPTAGTFNIDGTFSDVDNQFLDRVDDFGPFFDGVTHANGTATISPAHAAFDPLTVPAVDFVGNTIAVSTVLNRTSPPIAPIVNAPVTFTLAGPSPAQTVTLPTQPGGVVATTFPLSERGPHTVTASYAGDSGTDPTSLAAALNAYQRAVLTMTDVTGIAGTPMTLSARLNAIPSGAPLADQTIHFSFGGAVADQSAITNGAGVATVTVLFNSIGTFAATASFDNAADYFADHLGNVAAETINASVVVSDPTAPAITPTVSGVIGNNGWYTSDVVVSWNVADPETAITTSSGCDSTTVNTDGAAFSFTCTATSGGGTNSQTVTLKRDATPPTQTLPANITVGATSANGAPVNFTVTRADATSGVASFRCNPAAGSQFAIGATVVNCSVTDNAGLTVSDTFTVAVNDTVAPEINNVTPSRNALSPPNHQMVPITLTVAATDNLGIAPVCSITSITSNEPQNGLGDGDTPNDWLITGPLSAELRAERSGKGSGRTYTFVVRCVDAAGNAATSSTNVTVPKSQGKGK